jgi:hypothetical protein
MKPLEITDPVLLRAVLFWGGPVSAGGLTAARRF